MPIDSIISQSEAQKTKRRTEQNRTEKEISKAKKHIQKKEKHAFELLLLFKKE